MYYAGAAGPYAGEAVGDAGALATALLLLSHVPLILAGVYNAVRGRAYLATSALVSAAVSLMYHACRGLVFCFGFASAPDALRKADHVAALNVLGAIALHVIQYDIVLITKDGVYEHGAWARYVLPYVCLLAVQAWPYAAQSAVLVVMFVVVVAVDRVARYGLPLSRWNWRRLALGTAAAVVGLVCYFYDGHAPHGDSLADALVHSAWHVFIGLALWAFSDVLVAT